MEVKLLTSEASVGEMEHNAAMGALTCRGNADKEHVPSEVLARIIKAGHDSVLEHITLTYSVKCLSRACLQELARHRHISLSVESTRHTLKKFIATKRLIDVTECDEDRLNFVLSFADFARKHPELPNDELKYFLPEFWPTNLVLTSNVRELRHILKLRTAPAALKEFRELARKLYEAVPESYKYLLKDCVYQEASNEQEN